jgi:hypothetical protein
MRPAVALGKGLLRLARSMPLGARAVAALGL